jgi:hypothetical protein
MKKICGKQIFIFTSIIIISFYLFNGCSVSTEIQSSFSDGKIVVDGNHQDWGTSISYVKDDNIAFGFKNDKENLYICMVTSDRTKIMKILSTGLTISIKSDNGKIGIKFPVRPEPGEMSDMRMHQPDQEGSPETNDRITTFISKFKELQVLDKNDMLIFSQSADLGPGFIAKMGYNMNQFVYEIQIPLINNDLVTSIFSNEIKQVKINFATGEINRDNMKKNKMEGEGESEEMGSHQGGNRSMHNHSQGEKMDFKPLDYSFNVILYKQI